MKKILQRVFLVSLIVAIVSSVGVIYVLATERVSTQEEFQTTSLAYQDYQLVKTKLVKTELEDQVASLSSQLQMVLNRDEYQINQALSQEITEINVTYKEAVTTYEKLLRLKEEKIDTNSMDESLAEILTLLADRNYASASASIQSLEATIDQELAKILAAKAPVVPNAPENNSPPGSGYQRQTVVTDSGSFVVDVVAADLGSTRVIVDTASDGDCTDNCPVLSLADYVARNGAYAGVNGSYFCPASYPSCAGKTNSFDTLAMGKNKHYHNSDNNIYSTVPAVIFGNGWVRFVGQSLEWGRDTGVEGVLANQPLLVSGGNVVFGGDGDPKKGSKSNRSFVANKGNTVFIGVVRNATVAESARALSAMGMENALNLDAGGSTALWSGGYKLGPGRNIPNAILFVPK